MIEDKEGDAEKNEEVDVELNNTKAASPFSLFDNRFFNHHCHIKCVCLCNEEEKENTCELCEIRFFNVLLPRPPLTPIDGRQIAVSGPIAHYNRFS
jgi:hypothetical protein